MFRQCELTGEKFEVTEGDLRLYDQLGVDLPRLCPMERQRRRISFRNFNRLYYRTCSATGQRMLSMYDEAAPFPVVQSDVWWGDGWDARQFGREFDFSRSFFDQYRELSNSVPRYAMMNIQSENSQYSNFTLQAKDCYLVFGCVRDEACLYGHIVWDSKDCVDTLYAYRCEWCSNSVDIVDCYSVHYSTECTNCQESYFLHDCANCKNCFGCWNLRRAEYCVYNKQYSRDDYQAFLAGMLPLRYSTAAEHLVWLSQVRSEAAVWPEYFGERNEDVSGNHLYGSKNIRESFDVKECEDSAYCYTAYGVENCLDLSFIGAKSRFCVDSLTCMGCDDTVFSHCVGHSANAAYCELCYQSHDIFGCIGMRNAEYSILNRSYSKCEYSQLRERIVSHMRKTGEWGEFFPAAHSPFAYNESIAHDYMPLDRASASKRGLRWRESVHEPQETRDVPPDLVTDAKDDITRQVFSCGSIGKAYRIIPQEFEFCVRMGLPLPRNCPDVRHEFRMQLRAKREIQNFDCAACGARGRGPKQGASKRGVFCRQCYERSVSAD